VARRRERLEALARRLEAQTGAAVDVLAADLTEPGQLHEVVERLHEDTRIDLLVNNAGFGGYGPFAELEPDFADRLIGVQAMVVMPGMVETEPFGTKRGGDPSAATLMSAHDVAQAIVVGLELGEVVCVPGLEDMTLFDALRNVQKATLFGRSAAQLAERYRR